jgi:hypothetical protein
MGARPDRFPGSLADLTMLCSRETGRGPSVENSHIGKLEAEDQPRIYPHTNIAPAFENNVEDYNRGPMQSCLYEREKIVFLP